MKDLGGKTAFITGAGAGIGLGMARAFASAGMILIIADIESEPLETTRAALAADGTDVRAFQLDVSDLAAFRDVADRAISSSGNIHLLCNNAGVTGPITKLEATTDENWDWIVGVNLMGVVNGLQAFLPHMLAHGEACHIVNTASIAGVRRYPGLFPMGTYVTTKFAVVGLTEALATDLAGTSIGVSALCPDMVDTNLFDAGRNRPAQFGGAYQGPKIPDIDAVQAAGLTPDTVGARVVAAIQNDEFYIFTHPENRAQAEARFAQIRDGFDNLDAWLAG